MTDRFTAARGRKVISRASAEELGTVSHLVVDVERRRIAGVVVGKRRRARLVDWADVTGFGPDAVLITDEQSLREPSGDADRAAARGHLELLGRGAMSDLGSELGKIDDVIFDPDSGALVTFVVGDHELPGRSLLGAGSFAVILGPDDDQSTGETPRRDLDTVPPAAPAGP